MDLQDNTPLKVDQTNQGETPREGSPATASVPRVRMAVNGNTRRFAGSGDDPERARHNGHHPPHYGTNHLKCVPEEPFVREQMKAAAAQLASTLPPSRPVSKDELIGLGQVLLEQLEQQERFLGFAMVLLGNAFWQSQFLATPFDRRLLLIPREIDHADRCRPADGGEQPDGGSCLACSLLRIRHRAEELGYRVLTTDRSSLVLQTIFEQSIDGILGVASMDVLEKAVDKVLISGVPSYVVPLGSEAMSSSAISDPAWDADWLEEMLERYEPSAGPAAQSYLPLMRAATRLFTDDFDRLLPRMRTATPEGAATPLGITEDIAYDWLANGGKRFRPFITLAAYDAVATTEKDSPDRDFSEFKPVPDAVGRVAMAIEAFHKASLVHDDIQDDDQFRYGRETLHRSQGVGPAINIGDYLIGLGYRLVNSCHRELGADVAADIVRCMADAHLKLCDGQGAEMAWQLDPDWSIRPEDALHIYALKTSPAFEAALHAGLRMAGPVDDYAEMIPRFSRHLGIGFQVINDFLDWQGDAHNKLLAGQDALAVRPTMLLALALDAANDTERAELRAIYQSDGDDDLRLHQLMRLFTDLGAFERAAALIDECRAKATALADDVEPERLRRFLRFLVDTVLAHDSPPPQLARAELSIAASQAVSSR